MAELALLERIAAMTRVREGTELGIGDDAALVDLGGRAVLAQDLLVEGVHFRRRDVPMADLGHRALAVNLSDIAAMGARPVAALAGVVVPADLPDGDVEDLYRGMEALAELHDLTVAGGDTTSGPALVLAVTVAGRPVPGVEPVTRAGALPGDLLCVTGALGAAAAGLLVLGSPALAEGVPEAGALVRAHRRPTPRLAEGARLAAGGARAMMDLSDGLALDAWRMARASGARLEIDLDAVPVAPGVPAVAARAGREADVLAATGGDDYELLAAVAPDALTAPAGSLGTPLTPVGRVLAGEPGLTVRRHGAEVALDVLGWEH